MRDGPEEGGQGAAVADRCDRSIARDKKGRESCSSKSMCERYDTAISAMEKRQARHETRLARFKEDVDKRLQGLA